MDKYLIAGLVILAAAAVYLIVRRAKRGSACCGTPSETVRRISVKDKNKAHYPFTAELSVSGMMCENCARKVENALNGLEGIWAKADLGKHTATVRCQSEPDTNTLREAVREAGYVVTDIRLTEMPASAGQ